MTSSTVQKDGVIEITRHFNAPVQKIWAAWTEPDQVMGWWGPAEFTAPQATLDLRVGGAYHFCMRGPDGKDYWTAGVYEEIEPRRRIVYTDSFADADGNVVPASDYGMTGDWPDVLRVTLTFEDRGGATIFTLRHEGVPGAELRELCAQSWNQSLDKLAGLVESGG